MKKILSFLGSVKLVVFLFVTISVVSLIGTFIPQNLEPMEYIQNYGKDLYNIIHFCSFDNIYESLFFMILMGFLTLNLAICGINRFSLKLNRIGSTLTHIGMVIIFLGATVGIVFGQRGSMKIPERYAEDSFYLKKNNHPVKLDFNLYLEDFMIEKYSDDQYALIVTPPGYSEPEQLAVELESEYVLGNNDFKITILKYVADFVMDTETKEITSRSDIHRNPAVYVETVNLKTNGLSKSWFFAEYPNMHNKDNCFGVDIKYIFVPGKVKDYKSKLIVREGDKHIMEKTIEVNNPLVYKGYAFFQATYDQQNLRWTGLSVVKDPGVGIVYAGFILVIVGIMCIVYIRK